MNAQDITGRMLQSLSADKNALISNYLMAFGVTKVGDTTLPPVFKTTYQPQWEAFNREFDMRINQSTPEKLALYRILEFVRYMQAVGINPFAKTLKHPRETKISSSTKFKPVAVYEKIIESNLFEVAKMISDLMRTTQMLRYLKIFKSKSEIKNDPISGNYVLTTNFVLEPAKKGEALDAVLARMQGTLYTQLKPPGQLQQKLQTLPKESRLKPKVLNAKADQLIASTSFENWLPLRKTKYAAAYLIRARDDRLVFKVNVSLDIDVNLGTSAKNTIFKLWMNAFKSI